MDQNSQEGTNTPPLEQNAQTQNAQADLKKVADSAKAAAQGFDFMKLFEGRLDNMNYLYLAVASFVAGWILMYIPILGWLANLALLVLGIGATMRRLHDIHQPGILVLVFLVPILNVLALVYLCWKLGDVGANTYGNPPEKNREFFRAVLNT